MIRHLFNWKLLLFVIAIVIVSGTIVYSQYVANKIAIEERKNVEAWVEAERTILNADNNTNINLASIIVWNRNYYKWNLHANEANQSYFEGINHLWHNCLSD